MKNSKKATKILGKMKCLASFFVFLSTITSSAQNISGLYSGTLTNDSLKMTQSYELALSEYKGKITGYSYITFVSNDTFYYGIKRIKATRENGQLIVEDVAMLSNNYPKRPDKGVHVTNIIPLPAGDSILNLNGTWQTNKTKRFYSIGGDLRLRKENDSTQSPLIAHLKELNEIQYQEEKPNKKDIAKKEEKQKTKEIKPEQKEISILDNKPDNVAVKEPTAKQTVAKQTPQKTNSAIERAVAITPQKEIATQNDIVKETRLPVTATNETATKKVEQKIIAQEEKSTEVVAQKENVPQKNIANEIKPKDPVPISNNANQNTARQTVATESKTVQTKPGASQVIAVTNKQDIATSNIKPITTPVATEKPKQTNRPNIENKEIVSNSNSPKTERQTIAQPQLAKETNAAVVNETLAPVGSLSALKERSTNTIQTVTVATDSLILSFYDNGVVDGDSISVFLNDQNIISKVKLTAAAVKKTVYTTELTSGEIKLTLVAENLGSLPPNTGLLIIQDGTQKYQIRFSADMQTNASVIIMKKKL